LKRALIGYGGHAREILAQMGVTLPCFVTDELVTQETLPLSSFDPKEYEVLVAVGDSQLRKKIVDNLPPQTKFFTFIHPTALIMDSNIKIGKGSFIGAYSILTTNITLGAHALLNRAVHIGHDSNIGNYFSAMPGSVISGNVSIKDKVYLGTNSSIKQKLTICSDCVIGLGSGVINSICKSGTYGGVPAKFIF
jgi:sugar O-acyltransferase (sialic acid O-acetyltransferase NeuD family)